MLTKTQFDVLSCIAETIDKKISQRNISMETGLSVGTVNKIIVELINLGYLKDKEVTELGYKALEPYKVKKAIIIAAGLGSRLIPITLNTPKPLIRVKGKRILENTLEALTEIGINEIYLVRGYLAKQFDELLYKYPNIKFIENEIYNEANNISSVYLSRELLGNCYILEADLLVYNKKIIKKYQYSTNYLTIPVKETDDWCFYLKGKYISKMTIGGKNCYKMAGISYWTEDDGKQLAKDVEKLFNSPGGKQRYWDQVPLEHYMDNYKISVTTCSENDIIEIDTFKELKEIDKTYDV